MTTRPTTSDVCARGAGTRVCTARGHRVRSVGMRTPSCVPSVESGVGGCVPPPCFRNTGDRCGRQVACPTTQTHAGAHAPLPRPLALPGGLRRLLAGGRWSRIIGIWVHYPRRGRRRRCRTSGARPSCTRRSRAYRQRDPHRPLPRRRLRVYRRRCTGVVQDRRRVPRGGADVAPQALRLRLLVVRPRNRPRAEAPAGLPVARRNRVDELGVCRRRRLGAPPLHRVSPSMELPLAG